MREVELYRNPGEKGVLRWEARSVDSRGQSVTGYGFTKAGALRDLRSYIAKRESRRARLASPPDETVKVDW